MSPGNSLHTQFITWALLFSGKEEMEKVDKHQKIGLPGKPEYNTRDPMAHHAEMSEAFGNDPTEQLLYAIEQSRREFKTESQLIDKAFGA